MKTPVEILDEQIIPDELASSGASIDFTCRLINDGNRVKRIYRYEFRNKAFSDLSLRQYDDFAHTLYSISEHFIVNHFYTEKDENFIFGYNMFRRDKIVLQFSVTEAQFFDTLNDIKYDFVDIFVTSIKLHEMNGSEHNLKNGQEYILMDFFEGIDEGIVKIPNEVVQKAYDAYSFNSKEDVFGGFSLYNEVQYR